MLQYAIQFIILFVKRINPTVWPLVPIAGKLFCLAEKLNWFFPGWLDCFRKIL